MLLWAGPSAEQSVRAAALEAHSASCTWFDFGAQPRCFSSADPASKRGTGSQRRRSFPLRRTFLQSCGERWIASRAVDEFGGGAERDHHASRGIADRVRAFGAHLERAVRSRRAINPAGGGRQKDLLRRTRQSPPERTCPPVDERPSRRRAAGTADRSPPRNRPRPPPAARGSWAQIRQRLAAPPVRARAAAVAVRRPAQLEQTEQTEASGRRRAEPRRR